eukprot:scaffold341_cov154-Ochromonas_danica.AAC.12
MASVSATISSLDPTGLWDVRCSGRAVLAQSVERKALNLVVGGSSPPVGDFFFQKRTVRSSCPLLDFWTLAGWVPFRRLARNDHHCPSGHYLNTTVGPSAIMRSQSADRSRRQRLPPDSPASPNFALSFSGGHGGSPTSEHSANSDMLDTKLTRKKAESELQQLANRVALLKMEEQRAVEKVTETQSRAAEILA